MTSSKLRLLASLTALSLMTACMLTLPKTVLRGTLTLQDTDGGAPKQYRYEAVVASAEALDGGVPDFPTFPDAEPAEPAEPSDAGVPPSPDAEPAEPTDAGVPSHPDAGPSDMGMPPSPDMGTPPPPATKAGMNLGFPAYWAKEAAFLNGFRMAEAGRRTIGPDGSWSPGNVRLGPDGWVEHLDPGHDAIWIVPTGLGGPHVMTWTGQGCFSFGAVETAPSNVVQGAQRATMDLQPHSFILVRQSCVGPKDLVLVPARHEQLHASGEVWYPEFRAALAPFGAVRTMDWAETNHDPPGTWANRFSPAGSQEGGVAWEWHARLANDLDKDLWVTVPHRADRAYLTQLAALLEAALEPGRHLYVEHSNEVWNGMFPQAQFAQNDPSAGGGDYTEGMRWHGRRTALIEEVFAAEMPASRFTTVLGCWAANSWTCARSFESMPDAARSSVRVAIAPYFGHGAAQYLNQGDALWDHLSGPALDEVRRWLDEYESTWANDFGASVSLLAYEGGQHVVSGDVAANRAAQTSPRMGDVYRQYLALWESHPVSGGPFMFYSLSGNWGQHGFWGHLEVIGGPAPPKYEAAAAWARSP